jgi:hypothetical protein
MLNAHAKPSIPSNKDTVATSYLNRIRILTGDCYHAGIPNNDFDLVNCAIHGGSNYHYYAASFQRFVADLRQAKLNDKELPSFSKLESHLLNIDESRGLTLPSQNQRNYNQHANAARQQFHHHSSRPSTQRNFSPRQQQALSLILCPLTQQSSSNRPNHQPPNRHQSNQFPTPTASWSSTTSTPKSTNFNNQRRPQNTATPLRQNTSTNATNIVCNNCGRIGYYARQCPTANRSQNNNRNGNHPRTTANNVNAAPQNQHAYFVTNASPSTTSATHYH